MPKILHTFRTGAKKAFDIPFAGWILSVATFAAGTLVPAVYSRYSFDGVSVGKIAEVSYIDGGPELYIALNIRVANATKAAIALEAIESNVPDLSSEPLKMSIQDVGIVDPTTRDISESLPILIRAEKVVELQIKEVYSVQGTDDVHRRQTVRKVIQEMKSAMNAKGFRLSIVINGKLRRLTLQAQPDALRKSVPPLPPPPPLPGPRPAPRSEVVEPPRSLPAPSGAGK